MDSSEQPLKATQAAKFIGICRDTLDDWFDQGLEHYRIGNRIFTTREAIHRFMRRQSGLPESEPPQSLVSPAKVTAEGIASGTRISAAAGEALMEQYWQLRRDLSGNASLGRKNARKGMVGPIRPTHRRPPAAG
jgi:hypothetical protein